MGRFIGKQTSSAIEVYRGIRKEVGDDFPLVLLNSADFMKGGFTEEESMQVVKTLSEDGIDLIEDTRDLRKPVNDGFWLEQKWTDKRAHSNVRSLLYGLHG